MFLTNCWQVAAYSTEIGQKIIARTLLGKAVILYRRQDASVVALEDRCPHRYLPLSLGRLVNDNVECGYHGLTFNGDGKCVRVPGEERIPASAKIVSYPVVERYGFVWIWLGDVAADNDLVPDFHWMTDPLWVVSEGYHHFNAAYQLINDNLLDLSHETFVHPDTIGTAAVAEAPLSVEVHGGTVRATRVMEDCPPPPFYRRASGFSGNIDRWHTTNYTPPGFCVIETGSRPAGTDLQAARRENTTRERMVLNLVTPETAASSHYFWAISRCYDLDDAELTKYIRDEVYKTFSQDKDILEAQQRALGENVDSAFRFALKADRGAIMGRRLLQVQIRNQAGRAAGLE